MVFILYFWLRIVGKNTSIKWHFYNFTKLFLKAINKVIIYFNSNNWGSRFFCNDIQFDTGVSLPICSYCKLLHFNVIIWRHYWNEKRQRSLPRVPVSQNDCFMEVRLSVFGVELVLLHYHIPHVSNQYKTLLQDMKILTMLLLSVIEKFIDWLETKMIIVDPSILGQHVQLFKNNYFKACTLTPF